MYKASIGSKWQASRGILRHLCPSAWKHAVVFGIKKRGGRFVPKRRDVWSNLQEVDGRSHIGSGIAWMTNADSHDSDQNSTLQFKKRLVNDPKGEQLLP